MTIAPEGRTFVGVLLAAAIVLTFISGTAAVFAWLILLFVAQFFREPVRNIVAEKHDIVSAADGRVVFVGAAKSPSGDDSLKISVFMNVFNVHANRAPAAGAVVESERIAGSFFNAALDKASSQNERHLIVIDSVHGKITCVQIAGLLARRVLCYAKTGGQLTVGERYGFIRFGSRADVYLPPHILPAVALGDKVTAGITHIARTNNMPVASSSAAETAEKSSAEIATSSEKSTTESATEISTSTEKSTTEVTT